MYKCIRNLVSRVTLVSLLACKLKNQPHCQLAMIRIRCQSNGTETKVHVDWHTDGSWVSSTHSDGDQWGKCQNWPFTLLWDNFRLFCSVRRSSPRWTSGLNNGVCLNCLSQQPKLISGLAVGHGQSLALHAKILQKQISLNLRYVKDWVQSIYVIRRVRGNNYIVCGES